MLGALHNSLSKNSKLSQVSALPTAGRRRCTAFPPSIAGALQPRAWHKGLPTCWPLLCGPAGPPECKLILQTPERTHSQC